MSDEFLMDAEIFAGLTAEQIRRVAERAEERKLKPGEVIFRVGDDADQIYVVRSGTIELTFPLLVMGVTKDVRFQMLEAGRALAWSALVPPHKLTMGARATAAARLVGFRRQDLLSLFAEEPACGYSVMSNLARVIGARLHEAQILWIREVQRDVAQTYH